MAHKHVNSYRIREIRETISWGDSEDSDDYAVEYDEQIPEEFASDGWDYARLAFAERIGEFARWSEWSCCPLDVHHAGGEWLTDSDSERDFRTGDYSRSSYFPERLGRNGEWRRLSDREMFGILRRAGLAKPTKARQLRCA